LYNDTKIVKEEGEYMQELANAILHLILVSIPEELFLTIMTLIFMKRFDMLDIQMWKLNFKSIMIPVLPVAIMINISRYVVVTYQPVMMIATIALFYIILVYILKQNSHAFSFRDYKKILMSLSFSFFILGLMESVTIPLILFLLNKSLTVINDSTMWNFIATVPSRVLEFLFVGFSIVKHNNVAKIKMFDEICKNNFLLFSVTFFVIIFNIIAIYSIKLIGIDRILQDKVSEFAQILISMSVLVIPAVLLFYVLLLINFFLVKQKEIEQTYKNLVEQDDIMLDIEY